MQQRNQHEKRFHITVGAVPHGGGEVSLQHDLQLLKAALLYADGVDFCSVSTSFIALLLQFGRMSAAELLKAHADATQNRQLLESVKTVEGLQRKKHRSSKELITLRKLKSALDKAETQFRQYLEQLVSKTGFNQLETAFDTGLVSLKLFDATDASTMALQYFEAVSAAVVSGDTYPLFDDQTGQLVQSAIDEGRIAPSNVSMNRAKQVGLSSDLLQRLPLFDDASIDEIIDIRKELDKPLIRFRSAIIGFTEEVHDAPWDKDFSKEAELVFRKHIEPAVLDIEAACAANRFLLRFIPDLIDKPVIPTVTSVLGVLLAQSSQLPDIITAGLGITAGAASALYRTAQGWREANRAIESNQLYFYYKVGQRLTQ